MLAASWHWYLRALHRLVKPAAGDTRRPPRQRRASACSDSICHNKLCSAQPLGQVTGLQNHPPRCTIEPHSQQCSKQLGNTLPPNPKELGKETTAWKGFLCDRHRQLAEVISDHFPWEGSLRVSHRWCFGCSPHFSFALLPLYPAGGIRQYHLQQKHLDSQISGLSEVLHCLHTGGPSSSYGCCPTPCLQEGSPARFLTHSPSLLEMQTTKLLTQ